MIFVTDNGQIRPDALAEFERRFDELPVDYRAFISLHNGVTLSGVATLWLPGAAAHKYAVETIVAIPDEKGAESVAFQMELWAEDYPEGAIPVATDGTGNTYLMALEGAERGKIYFLDHELVSERKKPVSELFPVVDSFRDSFRLSETSIRKIPSQKSYYTFSPNDGVNMANGLLRFSTLANRGGNFGEASGYFDSK